MRRIVSNSIKGRTAVVGGQKHRLHVAGSLRGSLMRRPPSIWTGVSLFVYDIIQCMEQRAMPISKFVG